MTVVYLRLLFGALFDRKLRLFLSVLGISIGVAALVVMVSVGEGTKRKIVKEFKTFGSDLIVVAAGRADIRGGRPIQLEIQPTLKLSDAEALKRVLGVVAVAPVYDGSVVAEYKDNTVSTTVVGTTADFFKARRFTLEGGRIFSEKESLHNAKVAVLGAKVKEELFGSEDPLGKRIRISKIPFTVIGVLKSIGVDASGRDQDDQIIVPISSCMNRLFNVDYLKSILVQVESEKLLPLAERAIDAVLRKRHQISLVKEKDYTILKAEEILKYKSKTATIFSALLASISALSLFVGTFGIAAVMILSVKERTQEIGIRKALGATKRSIALQFFFEGLIITSFGAFLGLVVGFAVVFILSAILKLPLVLSAKPAFIAFLVTLIFGVASSVYPAFKAASVDPIQSLKY